MDHFTFNKTPSIHIGCCASADLVSTFGLNSASRVLIATDLGTVRANMVRTILAPLLSVAVVLIFYGLFAMQLKAQVVSAVQTTADQTQLLQSQPSVSFNEATGSGAYTITVTDTRKQPFDGVGAALTDSGAWLIAHKLTSDQRSNLLKSLFGHNGAGLDVLTTGLSGSGYDVNPGTGAPLILSYTYDDLSSGTDFHMAHFSVSRDDAYIVPILRQIFVINPDVKLFGVPYSAPAWMKDSGTLDTGTFIAQSTYERSFATYFVKYVEAYRERHLPIYALVIENEPDYVSGTYPSMLLPAATEARIVAYLGPSLKKAGFGSVKILGWDHNWSVPAGTLNEGPGRRVVNVSGKDDGLAYPEALLSQEDVNAYLAGTAYHCYGGDPSVQLVLKNRFPSKDIWNTECAGESLKTDWVHAFDQDMAHEIIPEIRDWSRSHVWWTLVQDQNFGPQYGNCTSANCSPLVVIDTRKSPPQLVYRPGYYMLAQIGRFVRPGAYVVSSSDSGIPEVAFKNPDGSYVLVAYNRKESATAVTVNWNDSSFKYIIAPNAIVTFTWVS